ncbi:MAG: UDP-glucose/GDP-mannose dehydrogenase family protein [Micrococcaceae bacterium]
MLISVIGCGYLGAVHAACMAEIGHNVIGIDVDNDKISQLKKQQTPFYEPGLADMIAKATAANKLNFSTNFSDVADATVHFIGVGTPQSKDSEAADTTFVLAAINSLLPSLKPGDVVVGKSTVPVGTAIKIAKILADNAPETVLVWNPEFLREGFAVKDTLSPDRIVYGLSDEKTKAKQGEEVLDQVYEHYFKQGIQKITTNYSTAELVKVSANSFLATKISFINAIAEVCEVTGGNVRELAYAIGLDERIGSRFLNAGIGFGGGCLPKDIRALKARVEELDIAGPANFLREVDTINKHARERIVEKFNEILGGLKGKKIAVLGLAFKADSDDLRDSPALSIAQKSHEFGAEVVAYDPEAINNPLLDSYDFKVVSSTKEAVKNADLIFVGTEWREFKELDTSSLSKLVNVPRVFDGKNCLESESWVMNGFEYYAPGISN